ncbi:MAG TPA: single-stranded-DNA-specific exonuclease RecJ [Bacteroidales bacterium]|nr:single-stranded-DNA-specific exonuclease RecJ [Bacteroidales bacterium]HRZ48765.1 single-stranded-DNA-specific exonuclease RecJ [Bacteroidales bacterium]
MQIPDKRWVLKPQGKEEEVDHLATILNIDKNLANLLVQRDIKTYEEARTFFRPDLNTLHDPFLMKDMDKAVARIQQAVSGDEKIMVYGDYDVDGTTAVALVYSFLKTIHDKLGFYVPDRYKEGYGISYMGIDYAKENGFSLIIALDCGIKANEKIEYAKEKGIDFIICDHHLPGDVIPDAVAVLDTKRPDCSYPFKGLAGCGVGFKLIQAIASTRGIPFQEIEKYLDLVVISIASDIVPIVGENRIMAYHGLKLINTKPRKGIEAILSYTPVKQSEKLYNPVYFTRELNINDLVFLIGPRINAAGRIGDARNSVELLICEDPDYAVTLGKQIDNFNKERREKDMQAFDEALEMISSDPKIQQARATVVFHEGWSQGVLGIVASRLTEVHYKPTIVLTTNNGLYTGSARSVKGFDIYEAIDHCSDLLEHFGGHTYAAGLSMKPENFNAFKKKFTAYVAGHITDEMLTPEIEIDAPLGLGHITPKFYKIMKQFAPFGPGNMTPVFMTDEVIDKGFVRIVGNNHLKLDIIDPDRLGPVFPAIAFQQGEKKNDIQKEIPFSICYQIEENEWNGNVTLQLNIKDIHLDTQKILDYNRNFL